MTQITTDIQPDSFEAWTKNRFASSDLQERLQRANVLILPVTVPNSQGFVFASVTPDLLSFLNSNATKGIIAEVPVDDQFYNEVVLHGRMLNLGKMISKKAIVPVLLGVIANFATKELADDGDNSKVRFELIVDHGGGDFRSVKYDGPAKTFEKSIRDQIGESAAPAPSPDPSASVQDH